MDGRFGVRLVRLPDFIVIGTAKSGTTTLYRWLSAQPETVMPLRPSHKEPHFFVNEDAWARGLESYAALFEQVPTERLCGEASPGYTKPDVAALASQRIAQTLPKVRLIAILRHPVDRLRSAYRHGLQQGRRPVALERAVREQREPLVDRSRYHDCLAPYFDRFDREQLCVVRFEDVIGGDHAGWRSVLRHVGVTDDRDPPPSAHNVSADKEQYPRGVARLVQSGRLGGAARLPAGLRTRAKQLLERLGPSFEDQLATSRGPVPRDIVEELREDTARLERLLGCATPLWADETWDRHGPGVTPAA